MNPSLHVEGRQKLMRDQRDEQDDDGHDQAGERPHTASERSLAELVNDAWLKAELLIRQEIRLGLTETSERIDKIRDDLEQDLAHWKRELMAKIAGGALAFIGLSTLAAALVLLLAQVIAPWLSALIVGAGIALGGGLLLLRGVRSPRLQGRELIPTRTVQSIQQDARSVKEAMK